MAHKLKTGAVVTVAIAGTAVKVSATSIVSSNVTIQSDPANITKMYVGDSTVTAITGVALEPGQSLELVGDVRRGGGDEYDLKEIFINADTNGDKVRVLYSTRQ